jgi:acetyl esterase/lipase
MLLLFACLALASPLAAPAQEAAPAARKASLTLEDLYSDNNVISAHISPSGKFIAASVRSKDQDAIVMVDLATGEKKIVTKMNKDAFGNQLDVHIGYVVWKTEDRLLFQVISDANEDLDFYQLSRGSITKLGWRLFGINRDGKNLVPMFNEQWEEELVGAFDTSDIASMLWKDPEHILVRVGGWDGRSLFKVDVNTGKGKVVERQKEGIIDWWFDVDGAAVVRVEYSLGTMRYYRKLPDGKWKKYYSVRRQELEELPDFALIGPSADPTKFYVLARPPGKDRIGVYLYDLANEDFGAPLVENATYDINDAGVSTDGARLMYHCYDEHTRICDYADATRNAHMRGLRKFFEESANVEIAGISDDGNTLLLLVDGPSNPPSYYYYLVDKKAIEFVGQRQGALRDKALPSASVIKYKTRDGLDQVGYLTLPPGAQGVKGLPLVLYVHGGPQSRDRLQFDHWVQYLAARGYAVFQPNFRGSGGYGLAYETSGWREWGRKMQDDLGDGVKTLVDQGIVDPARVCIAGGSYGGYAALAGATFTPAAYRCAVSLAGVADLEQLVRFKKKKYGADSDVFDHYVKKLGDPDKDRQILRDASPFYHVDAIKIPILLIHGDDDEIVPIEQSETMQAALNKAGKKTELITLEEGGHGGFSREQTLVTLSAIGTFLWDNLGKGYGVDAPPVRYTLASK